MGRYDTTYVRDTYIAVLNAILDTTELFNNALAGKEMDAEEKAKWIVTALLLFVALEKDTVSSDNITINIAILDHAHLL
jgi:hypothetical protein